MIARSPAHPPDNFNLRRIGNLFRRNFVAVSHPHNHLKRHCVGGGCAQSDGILIIFRRTYHASDNRSRYTVVGGRKDNFSCYIINFVSIRI